MRKAQSPNDLLFNLSEIRPKHAVKRFRKSIIEDYPGDRCAYCGRPASSWTLDHIIPKSKGGPTRRWNLVRCCAECNGRKSNHDLLPWYRPQYFWDEDRENTVFGWMRENSSIDAMIALENSLREGTLDQEALEELKRPEQPNFFDTYCDLYPSEPECLIYDC
tara:strand:- start:1058 stop:1546 length:489 start_codon:yes stop_codon:yes gene_type:complete